MGSRYRRFLCAVALLPLLSGCGAGLVTGIVAGSDRGETAPVLPPSLRVVDSRVPMLRLRGLPPVRTLLANNYLVPPGMTNQVRLEVRALGATTMVTPAFLTVDSTANQTTIVFGSDYSEILTQIPDLTAADVDASVFLFVGGEQVAPPATMTFIRQRVASLAPVVPGPGTALASVLGTTEVRLRVTGRPDDAATTDEFRMALLRIGAPEPIEMERRSVERVPDSDDWYVSAVVPASDFPDRFQLVVEDDFAGVSSLVSGLSYKPAILAVAPPTDVLVGGGEVQLFGQGLAPRCEPLSLGAECEDGEPDFDRVQIEIQKGGRTLVVPDGDIDRDASSPKTLVFKAPRSPDGQPGPARIVVRVDLFTVEVTDEIDDLFVYRRALPTFGPRGARLEGAIAAVDWATVMSLGGAPDAVVLSSIGGLPRTELMVSEQNGMFSSFGPPIHAGEQVDPLQRRPSDLCAADFDADGRTDLLVVNRGDGVSATHTVVEGNTTPAPPFALGATKVSDVGDGAYCVSGDFNNDGATDVVLLPFPGSTESPRILLALPQSGNIGFAAPRTLSGPLRARSPFDAAVSGDFDDDGNLDIVAVSGGTSPVVVFGYSDGMGSFTDQRELSLTIPGYTPDAGSPAVGVHVQDGTGPRPLALVFAGLDASATTPPSVVTLLPSATPRIYDQPTGTEVLSFSAESRFVASSTGDLDGVPPGELAVAAAVGASERLRLFQWSGSTLAELVGAFPAPVEPIGAIADLRVGLGAAAAPPRVSMSLPAVFVRQRTLAGTDRIDTWLSAGTSLLSPDASLELAESVTGVLLGRFLNGVVGTGGRSVDDLCVVSPTGLSSFRNDGVGGFLLENTIALTGPIGPSIARVRVGASQDAVALVQADGQVAYWVPSEATPTLSSVDLRTFAPAAATWDVTDDSCLVASDVDGDGFCDLVVALGLRDPVNSTSEQTILLLMRGKALPPAGEFPFHVPDGPAQATLLAERASSLAVADFASEPAGVQEVVLALPDESNQVRFFRYEPGTASPTDDTLVWSYVDAAWTGLIAGEAPTELACADFDADGSDDLVVASADDSRVRVFTNPGTSTAEVDIASLLESRSPPAIAPGVPVALRLGDLDGDRVLDVVVITRGTSGVQASFEVASFVSNRAGELESRGMVGTERSGNTVGGVLRDAEMTASLADVNFDGEPDLILGWASNGAGDRNLRVLFGASR